MITTRTNIGIKRMGEIDHKAFQDTCKKRFHIEEANLQATKLCSLWQEHLKNPEWHPFKVVEVNGNPQVYYFKYFLNLIYLLYSCMYLFYGLVQICMVFDFICICYCKRHESELAFNLLFFCLQVIHDGSNCLQFLTQTFSHIECVHLSIKISNKSPPYWFVIFLFLVEVSPLSLVPE